MRLLRPIGEVRWTGQAAIVAMKALGDAVGIS
jgi:hypothetical protein